MGGVGDNGKITMKALESKTFFRECSADSHTSNLSPLGLDHNSWQNDILEKD